MYDEILLNIIKIVFIVGTISVFAILGFIKGRQF